VTRVLAGAKTNGKVVIFGKPETTSGRSFGIYGPGGIGKTTLAANAPGPVVFFDLDNSLRVLQIPGVQVVQGIETWQQMRDALLGDGWGEIKTLVIDSVTRAEELCVEHVLKTIKTEKGATAHKIEDYGYGKGYRFLYDTFLTLLSDLERHITQGRNVVMCLHDCTTSVPNPHGEDWIRYEPRLYTSDKNSLRLRTREWLDNLWFLGYDIAVDKSGKGQSSGTRTLWPDEMPHCMAKSRTIHTPMEVIPGDNSIWEAAFAAKE
jgi:hypothetical protein